VTSPARAPGVKRLAAGTLLCVALIFVSGLVWGHAGLVILLAVAGSLALLYLVWQLDPAWTLTAALVLSVFNNHWDALGVPPLIAPDRLLLVTALLAVVLRAVPVGDRPRVPLRPVHYLLGLTLAWAVGSAIAAEALRNPNAYFGLLDRFAVPFALFLLAPLVFRTPRQRAALLAALVAFGGYLGFTALFETLGPRALVFPRFILDPAQGIHEGRARGPFLEANANGFGLYAGAVASVLAVGTWKRPGWRVLAGGVAILCVIGLLFTMTRSVWLASAVATLAVTVSVQPLRRYAIPIAAGGTALIIALLALVPAVETRAEARKQAWRSVSERENVNAAALAMIRERPLLGFGWTTFRQHNADYFPLLEDVPQTAKRKLAIHNVFLLYTTELGLVGAALFCLSFALAIGGAIVRRGPPELDPWRIALLALALFWAAVAAFAPLGQVLPSYLPWLWAGVVEGGALEEDSHDGLVERAGHVVQPERFPRLQGAP
jgi:putative inorganic carbon (hco3(-)) transporter